MIEIDRRIGVVMDWERIVHDYVPVEDYAGRRAVRACQRLDLSVDEVRRANDGVLLGRYGLGPKGLQALRRIIAIGAPPPPLPWWVAEE